MQRHIELIWPLDKGGYELLPSSKSASPLSIYGARDPERIRGKGGKKYYYPPLIQYTSLFMEFANIEKTPEGLLRFVQKYGRLTKFGNYDNVSEVLRTAKDMKALLTGGIKRSNARIDNIRINSRLVFDERGTPSLILVPIDLLAGLWLQLADFLADGRTHSAKCLLCKKPFEAGPGAKRRYDAKFCSDEHRITYNSRKRPKKPKTKTTERRKK